MKIYQIVLISIPVYLIFVICFYKIIELLKKRYYKRKILKSKSWVENLGYCTYIVGKIRAGKTTCMAGLTNYLAEYLDHQAHDQIKTFCTIFHEFDLTNANKLIESVFYSISDSTKIAQMIVSLDEYKTIGNEIYFNYLKESNGFILLKSYVDAYRALLRNNYVYYFKSGFYCQFNSRQAMNFTPDMLSIKDRALKNDFSIERFSVIAEDEKQANGRGTAYSNDYKKDDSGVDTFKRFIGHFGHESIYYLTTSQEFSDDAKAERSLASSIICINDFDILNVYTFENSFFKILRNLINMLIKFKAYSKNMNYIAYMETKECSNLKHLLFRVNQRLKHIFSKSYLRYKFIKYSSYKDLYKKVDLCTYSAEAVELYFPCINCFGSINTFAFDFLYDYLISKSVINGKKKAVQTDEQLASKLLAKKERKAKKEEKAD